MENVNEFVICFNKTSKSAEAGVQECIAILAEGQRELTISTAGNPYLMT